MDGDAGSSALARRGFLGLLGGAVALAGRAGRAAPSSNGGFPRGFLWGTATAAYQIEGAATEDGRGPSVWDVFCKKPGAVFEGQTGDVACDHYHRWREDVGLIEKLGSKAYRFSVSWTRVLPEGAGRVNAKGLDFYDRLVDGLLKARVTPMCTLFHWDFPQALYLRGGWKNRDVAGWFADYAALVADRLSDRVQLWVTQNEPQIFMGQGHLLGRHAPGDKLSFPDFLGASHNSLRAHGRAVQALRAHARRPASVGYALAFKTAEPATERPEDLAAARLAQWWVTGRDADSQSWWLEPVLRGHYPEDGLRLFGKDMPAVDGKDLQEIHQPLDFLGLNIYSSTVWRQGAGGKPEAVPVEPGYPRSGVDWQPLRPAALYWGPRHTAERYHLPLYITENGLSTRDQVFLDGKVHDPHRIDYLHRVLLELARAIGDGADVRGYFAWSLLDNFEWADGYKQRFGMVYVDYPSGQRIPKDSYHWYRKVVASGGRVLSGNHVMPAAQVIPNRPRP
jgi:beta-glucosidase